MWRFGNVVWVHFVWYFYSVLLHGNEIRSHHTPKHSPNTALSETKIEQKTESHIRSSRAIWEEWSFFMDLISKNFKKTWTKRQIPSVFASKFSKRPFLTYKEQYLEKSWWRIFLRIVFVKAALWRVVNVTDRRDFSKVSYFIQSQQIHSADHFRR